MELESERLCHVFSRPVAETLALPKAPTRDVFEASPNRRFRIDVHCFHIVQGKDPAMIFKMRVDWRLWVFQSTDSDWIDSLIGAFNTKEAANAPLDDV